MIASVQVEIERSVFEIANHRLERTREGHASISTEALNKKIRERCDKARKQIALWKGWHTFMAAGSAAAAEPQAFDEESLIEDGKLPWVQALSEDTVCKEQLQLRLHRATSEMARTVEEQAWFAGDAANILRVYLFQQHKLAASLIGMQADDSPAAAGTRYLLRAQLQRLAQWSETARQLFKRKGGLLDAGAEQGAPTAMQ